jgi:hypothetical protein
LGKAKTTNLTFSSLNQFLDAPVDCEILYSAHIVSSFKESVSPMGYAAVWKVLEEMLIELRGKELTIPSSVMEDLKTAKTVIRMLTEDNRAENIEKTERYLLNVESFLVSEAQRKFGLECADLWLKRIDKANRIHDEEQKTIRFIPGVPRQQKWIRVTSSEELPLEKLKEIAEKMSISSKVQKDGSLLVLGEEKSIKDFVKKMTLKYKAKGKK